MNESGETVVLRGVNLENREWLWDIGIDSINYELEAIPEAIKVWGGNVVLLAFASGPVNRGEADYLAQLDPINRGYRRRRRVRRFLSTGTQNPTPFRNRECLIRRRKTLSQLWLPATRLTLRFCTDCRWSLTAHRQPTG